jgi:hypothetical protein
MSDEPEELSPAAEAALAELFRDTGTVQNLIIEGANSHELGERR